MVVHEVEGEKHNFWYVKELGYENCCSQPGTLFGLKEHEVQKHYDCSHIPQLQSYMWFVDTLSLFYVSSKVGSTTLMREDSIIEFIAVLCHQLLIWVAQHPLSPPQPPAPSVSGQIEQECFPRSQLSEYRVQLFCDCRHFLSGFTAFV